MVNYTKEEVLNGILKNDNLVLQYVYKKYFYKINFYIRKNSGNDDDAHDIFQEAIIIMYRKLKENRLEIVNASVETYLYSICKFLWLKQLEKRKRSKIDYYDDQEFLENVDAEDMNEVVEKHERYRLYQKHFKNLGKDCQKILQLYFDKVPFQQIAKIMGYKSEAYAKKRKFKCKEYLIKSIKQDLEYKNRIDDGT